MNRAWPQRIDCGQARPATRNAGKNRSLVNRNRLRVFGQRRKGPKMLRVGYARVSTSDQQTIPMQIRAMREYAALPLGSFCSF
jgi:predicted site-specific integrase-resolvase